MNGISSPLLNNRKAQELELKKYLPQISFLTRAVYPEPSRVSGSPPLSKIVVIRFTLLSRAACQMPRSKSISVKDWVYNEGFDEQSHTCVLWSSQDSSIIAFQNRQSFSRHKTMHECNLQKNNEIYEYKYTKCGQERTTFQCHLDAIFKFKLLANKLSKMVFWLMISIYENNKQKSCKKFCLNWVRLIKRRC